MARITIEDCLRHVKVKNRFLLCLIASKRAIDLNDGSAFSKIPVNEDKPEKPTVVALREIALGFVISAEDSK